MCSRTLQPTSVLSAKKAMASKGAKETLVSKLGFKSNSSGSKAEAELEKVRKENVHLRKKIDDQAKRHIKSPDSDKSKLLEVKGSLFTDLNIFSFLLFCFPCLFLFLCVFFFSRGFFPSRHYARGTISSCLLKSRNWKI